MNHHSKKHQQKHGLALTVTLSSFDLDDHEKMSFAMKIVARQPHPFSKTLRFWQR